MAEVVKDRRARRMALVEIKAQFELQGGTGYEGHLLHDDCRCAIGSLVPEAYDLGDAEIRATRTGLCIESAISLYKAHDGALREAEFRGMEGISTNWWLGYPRALIGTPAYDHVWSALERWAS